MSEYVPVAKQKNIVIFHCWKCTTRHCQSVLILWHFDCSLDFFNFSLRGTKIHPKNLHFWDQLKASFSSNICPDCISCHLEFQNFQGAYQKGGYPLSDSTRAYGARGQSSLRLLPKILHLLKNFLRTLIAG